MLEKKIVYDHKVTEIGNILVRKITKIMENGVEIPGARSYHRHVVSPGDGIKGQDERTVKIVNALHTPEVIAKYKAIIAENELKE